MATPSTTAGELMIDLPSDKLRKVLLTVGTMLIISGMLGDIQSVALSPLVGTIILDLGLTGSQVGWILNGVTLVGAMCGGLLSSTADRIGHKKVLIPLLVVTIVGSLVSVFAWNFSTLLIGRMLTGFAMPMTPIIWGLVRPRATAPQIRKIALTLGTVIALGIALSLVLGGFLLTIGANWKSIFWVVGVGALLLLILALTTPESPRTTREPVRVDWIGGLGLGVWLVALLLAITFGQQYGWASSQTLTAAGAFVVLIGLWVFQQIRTPYRIMAFHRDDLRQMVSGYSGQWAVNVGAATVFTFVPAVLQASPDTGYGFGLDVFDSSLPLLMLVPGSLVAQLAVGKLIPRVGPKVLMVTAVLVAVVGLIGLALFRDELWQVYMWVLVYAVGIVSVFNSGWVLTTASGRQDNISITVGLQYVGANVVTSVAIAIVVGALVPNAAGFFDESIFVTGFVGTAVVLGLLAVLWLFLVPRTLVDRHAAVAGSS